ncbi:hypothetical protein MMC13_005587 [Lambiella insularis]|nr:hypothetical protein [Lambiella insularis]
MDPTIEEAWRESQKLDKQLQASIADTRTDLHAINYQFTEYRAKCNAVIFLHFDFAQDQKIELKLWDTHGKINSRYRKSLTYFRDGPGKRRVVEQRKLMKNYLEFIKSSQRYYRSYIQKLASCSGGIPEIEAVARKFNTDGQYRGGSDLLLNTDKQQQILTSCHQSLIRLGDLSRYRETELVTKERNWGPAIGYYDLAGAIRPSSGASHNQLAVIALADGSHLRSTYHLYRALAVEEPSPTAKGNLELGFKKVIAAHEKGGLVNDGAPKDSSGSTKSLLGWFMLLHAQCYKGLEFAGHDELENEVVSQLVIDLKERSFEGTLQKLILVNIAAEYFATVRLRGEFEPLKESPSEADYLSASPESPEMLRAFFYFLRLNVKTMFTLLQVLQPELECFAAPESDQDPDVNAQRSEKITTVARRLLPGLRQYSSWLTCNSGLLVAQVGDSAINVQVKELWKTYANTLTLLAATFSASDLPAIEYLLEEDEDTLGFKPFEPEIIKKRYNNQETGTRKPLFHAESIRHQHPNLEMLGRIRDFLTDGLLLAMDESIPIELLDGTTTVAYREEGMPSELLASPEGHHATLSATSIDREDITLAKQASACVAASVNNDAVSQSASASVSANVVMNEMVDNIVGSETTNESEHYKDAAAFRAPPTPPSYSFDESPVKSAGNDTSYRLLGSSTAQEFFNDSTFATPRQPSQHEPSMPLLPSIYNSVFAPTQDEVSSRPSTAKGLSPPRSSRPRPSNENLAQSSFSAVSAPSSMLLNHTYQFAEGTANHSPQDLGTSNYGSTFSPMTALN